MSTKTTGTLLQAAHILKLIADQGLTAAQIEEMNPHLAVLAERVKAGKLPTPDALRAFLSGDSIPSQTFTLTINYDEDFEAQVAAGHYAWRNADLTAKRFGAKGKKGVVQVEAKLFHFGHNISSEDAIREMRAAGWEIGETEHLLAFGAKYPDEQRKYPIIAPGSVAKFNGNRFVPYLDRSSSERDLNLGRFGNGWYGRYRFLAVRNLSAVA